VTSREANTRSAEDLTGDVLAGALAARAAAEEAGDRYRALVESAPDGIVEVDGRGRIVLVNRETQRLFGYGGDELIGQSVGILIPERFREAHIQHEAKYARAPGLRAMGSGLELVGRRKDGTEFPVEISLSPQRIDGAAFVMAIVRDISERKRAEAALRESDERFRLIVDDVKDYGIFMLDPDGYLLSWNAGAELITGYAAEECQGWHCSAFYPRDAIERGTPAHELALAEEDGRSEVEGLRVRKDGSQYLASIVTTALRDEHGKLRGFSRVLRDITEQRRMQDERERLRVEAEAERERARIGMDLHDGIIQSIYAVGLNLEAAADDVRADPAEAQRRIDQAIEKLNDTIRDIRSYIFELRPTRFTGDLEESLMNLAQEFRVNSLIDTSVEIAPGLPSMDEDRGIAIFHVALEALANARKHSRATSVRLVLASDGGAVRVEVRDNGVGFDTGARHPEGHHGLRNMPVRVRAAGGAFSIESAPGAGTTVRVEMPVARDLNVG
jgi:PAS domain S-box-containing protein